MKARVLIYQDKKGRQKWAEVQGDFATELDARRAAFTQYQDDLNVEVYDAVQQDGPSGVPSSGTASPLDGVEQNTEAGKAVPAPRQKPKPRNPRFDDK